MHRNPQAEKTEQKKTELLIWNSAFLFDRRVDCQAYDTSL